MLIYYDVAVKYAADADRQFCDQNVMCMRSGLVIKTAPVVRTSLSSRFQSEGETRGSRDLAGVSATAGLRPQQLQPSSPAPHQSVAETGGESSEATVGQSAVGGGWMVKAGAGRSGGGMTRSRSLDFLSIITRFQLARRARAVYLDTDTVDNSHDEDRMYNALALDFIADDNSRFLYS